MMETVTTMVSLLLSAGAAGVIGASVWEDRHALRRALGNPAADVLPPLPLHTHRVVGPRPARFIKVQVTTSQLRAAA